MLCDRCETHTPTEPPRGPAAAWPGGPLGDLFCAACGVVLAADEAVRRALRKEAQLARFGLAGSARPLLEPSRGESS